MSKLTVCPYCWQKIVEGAKYCIHCGQEVPNGEK